MTDIHPQALGRRSRELGIVCDRVGVILWVNDCARQLTGARVGQSLVDLAAPGGAARVQQLLARAAEEEVRDFEVPMMVRGQAETVAFAAGPEDQAIAMVGGVLTDGYQRTQRELALRQTELATLNRELEESNRGVMALYAELDEKADSLRRNAEVKSRLVSNVSHEFRTPLNSILGLTRLLLARSDGPLNAEQEKQLGFILRSATELSELVNDLLDLSKMEAGKIRLHATRFHPRDLFSALRGMARPLQVREAVELVFDNVDEMPALETDEGKISQILRNLISNALKFTARGEVRVSSSRLPDGRIQFRVSDTGVGIAPQDLERVFEEFTQLENPLQAQTKGTGLGLSLSRKLAELLGGTLTVESRLGQGSTFILTVPPTHPEVTELQQLTDRALATDLGRAPVLVVEDDRQTLFLYEKYLLGSGFRCVPARTVDDARKIMQELTPAAIVLDIMLEGETSWRFLSDLKQKPQTRDIPVLVVTVTDRENKARALGADEFWMKPMDPDWLLRKLKTIAARGPLHQVLVIDDDEVSRYLVRRLLADTPYKLLEADGGDRGILLAREHRPDVILLDFVMPGMSAFEVLDELKAHPETRNIPVIIHTSKDLAEEERQRLKAETAAILSKQSLSRELALARIREALVKAGVTPHARDGHG